MASVNTSPGRVAGDLLERLPPQNLEAERGVLGAMLLDQMVCDDVAVIVRPEDFYSDVHQKLYSHLLGMLNEQRRIDLTLLRERLLANGDYEFVGGAAYLAELVESVQVAAHAVYYAEIVKHKAQLRRLIHASVENLRDAFDQGQEPREVLSRAEERLFSLMEQPGGVTQNLCDLIHDVWDRIDARMERAHELRGVPTGFDDLDDLMGGMRSSEL